jgi:putative restriction endonuclease
MVFLYANFTETTYGLIEDIMDDLQVRLAAFAWLSEQVNVFGDVLTRELLAKGFIYKGNRIPLVAPQGIFKPKILNFPLTITTTTEGPYDDKVGLDGLLFYRYRGNDPNHRDNVGLRRLFELKRPLIYFQGVTPGKYLAVCPVYIVGDNPINLTFKVQLDDMASISIERDLTLGENQVAEARRAYLTTTVQVRLHQRAFRERVLDAYRSQCAFCRLRHRELLDAAHILPDNLPDSQPVVSNGLSLCKLHHSTFDNFMLGITPDYIIQVRKDILDEEDGPVLQYGLKALHNTKLILPNKEEQWPNPTALDYRYQKFQMVDS